jgi:hypothetical protein
LDQGPKGKGVKIRKLIEDKIRRKRLKNHVFFLHNHPDFSFLLSAISCLVSVFLLLDWIAADHVFIAQFQRKQLVPPGPSYGRKERSCTTL